MPEPVTLMTLLLLSADIAGREFIKEATKDAYGALKAKVSELFGPRASKALEKAESAATYEQGRVELDRYVGTELDVEEVVQLQPLIATFFNVIKQDPQAFRIAESRVGLDIETDGSALVRDIENAIEVSVKIRAKKDVTIEGIKMARRIDGGK